MARKKSLGVNLADIAKQLNFSISTVSRALRNAEGIHPDTRTLILDTAAALGYNTQRSKSIDKDAAPQQVMALAQCNSPSSDQYFLAGMGRAAVPLNLSILSHHITHQEAEGLTDPKNQPAAMRNGAIDGLVLIHRWPQEMAENFSQKWPTVSLVHQYPNTNIDHIGIDDRMGMWSLVQHLKETGHTRIGFFGLCPEMSWACSRFAGFVEAMIRMKLSYNPADVISVTLDEALSPGFFGEGVWSQDLLARTQSGVDAWVCSSSMIAHSLCQFLTSQGIQIPDQVAVTGYHHDQAHRTDLPKLTTTFVADEELGSSALRRLLHRFAHPKEAQRAILLPTQLRIGDTTRKMTND